MKNINYIIGLFLLSLLLVACKDSEPFLYDEDSNGAYFDYEYENEFEKRVDFGDYIIGEPDTVIVTLKVKLLGYLMDEARTLAVKTKDIEGYEPADVTIGKVVFANKEYEKQIEVKVKRPQVEDVTYAVCIYLDGSGDIGTGVVGKNEINLFVTESYVMPDTWSDIELYQGAWSKEKQKFLVRLTADNEYYSKLFDITGIPDNKANIALNSSAVNALLANETEVNAALEFPIMKETDEPAYTEPYFWAEYEDVLGFFRSNKFCRFVGMLGGATTNNVAALFASEEARAKMEEEAENFHKDDVYYMLNRYYDYAKQGLPISEYRNLCWVEIKNTGNYKMRIPYWWEDPDNLGTAEIVKKYFGEYDAEKYQFMLKQVMKKDGAENFVAASIFPFVYDKENGTYVWDDSEFGKNKLAGEQRLKECYKIVKAANDRLSKFDIPSLPAEELE